MKRGRPSGSTKKPKCQNCGSFLEYNKVLKVMYCPKLYCNKFPNWSRDSMTN